MTPMGKIYAHIHYDLATGRALEIGFSQPGDNAFEMLDALGEGLAELLGAIPTRLELVK